MNGTSQGKAIKVYSALLSQNGTDAPTATVLQNDIGNIVWTRSINGQYSGTLAGAFPLGTTAVNICQNKASGNNSQGIMQANEDYVYIRTYNSAGALADTLLSNTLVEIRVYDLTSTELT